VAGEKFKIRGPCVVHRFHLTSPFDLARSRADSTTKAGHAARLTARHLNHVRDYITANLDKDVSLSELAGLVNLSRFHFIRSFKKITGMAPYQFVISDRVKRAKELFAEPNSSIAAVARSVGFHSTLQLDRAFHRLVGMTPSFYRDQVADNQSRLRRQEPANAPNLRAHPESLDSGREICRETWQENADQSETGECSGGAGVTFEVASANGDLKKVRQRSATVENLHGDGWRN